MKPQRQVGFLISAALHGVMVAGMLLGRIVPQPSPGAATPTADVLQVDVTDLAGSTDRSFDFDVEKIVSRGGRLFPFIE